MMPNRSALLMANAHPMRVPVLVVRNRRIVIQNEERPFFDNLKHSVGKEDGKLANQPPPDHNHRNSYLESVGCEPQKMPQE